MTAEQIGIGLIVVSVLERIYTIFTSGQKFDDRVQGQIEKAMTAEKKAKETEAILKQQLSDREFEFMAADIKRISDAISEIMRLLRESVATKQDILQMDARVDALEESNRDHYESFKKVREEIGQIRISCARYHRTPSDSSAFPRQQ